MNTFLLNLAALPLVAMAVGPADSWTGELPWTLYGSGGCEDNNTSTIAATGTTISLVKIAPKVFCQTDQFIAGPNTVVNIYTKFTKVACGSETAEFALYDCEDNSCSKCNETPELGEEKFN